MMEGVFEEKMQQIGEKMELIDFGGGFGGREIYGDGGSFFLGL